MTDAQLDQLDRVLAIMERASAKASDASFDKLDRYAGNYFDGKAIGLNLARHVLANLRDEYDSEVCDA